MKCKNTCTLILCQIPHHKYSNNTSTSVNLYCSNITFDMHKLLAQSLLYNTRPFYNSTPIRLLTLNTYVSKHVHTQCLPLTNGYNYTPSHWVGTYKNFNFGQGWDMDMRLHLCNSIALIESAKSLVPSNIIEYAKSAYHTPQLKSMAYSIIISTCIIAQWVVPTEHEQSIVLVHIYIYIYMYM